MLSLLPFIALLSDIASASTIPRLRDSAAAPVVDLGYALHRASVSDGPPLTYKFSNIRFAAPPIGSRRFTEPAYPEPNRTKINNGENDMVCPQAEPAWLDTAVQFITGTSFVNATPIDYSSYMPGPIKAGTTEDCLFLDVLVPKKVYDSNALDSNQKLGGAPVIVWIHGGGFVEGDKALDGNGTGLILQSQKDGSNGVIYVAINYRVGIFGWLSGLTYTKNGTPNLGLLDQQFALRWIQKYIHLFGGDSDNVTIMGESAGGGSVIHHITASGGGKGRAPFKRAIPQSPFLPIMPGPERQEKLYQTVLNAANVTSFDKLQKLSSVTLQAANSLVISRASYGDFVFGPVVDNKYVLVPPSVSLSSGKYDSSLQVMVGHNSDEGILFTSPFVTTSTGYTSYLETLLPEASPATIDEISSAMYPPPTNSSSGYTDQTGRVSETYADLIIQCNTHYLATAFPKQTYSYLFAIPPGWHSNDEHYTFYDAPSTNPSFNATVAVIMQQYITNFAKTGNPNGQGVPVFPLFSQGEKVQNLSRTYVGPQGDDVSIQRCKGWLDVLAKTGSLLIKPTRY
ncbi:carboxylesterase family protein-like protein [Tricladium varicosporioides]|nr:carboxylesterase family protein-like protein [Hymenoscyphus varicosporioides]